ncbi:MAG: tRNA (adenosine(37)-N6)-threonylcarbamoyltransferase complex dimerization subunit type 1 TsaB [Phormidesmis sp.]
MLGLAIHTASPQLGLMLQTIEPTDEAVKRHQVWDLGREVSSQLHVKLIEFMALYRWQDLSFVSVAHGPGGFTGTRIGVVAARTLAQQLEIPLFGVSTLAALAAGIHTNERDIAVMMPAKREAVFGAIYRPAAGELTTVLQDVVIPKDEWDKTLASWQRPLQVVSTNIGEGIAESVTGVMQLASVRWTRGQRPEWSSVMPFYGQHPVNR